MDPSDKIRALQGKTVLLNYKRNLATQPNTNINTCGGLSQAVVRYDSYEFREQIRDGLKTDCNTCSTLQCAATPYQGRTVPPATSPY